MSRAWRAMVVTDLDGTLLDSRGRLGDVNRATLEALGRDDVLRVVATGRSLFSALGALPADAPVDYLVFASGAGVASWPERELLQARHLEEEAALAAAERLRSLAFDFMLHAPVPENHRFWFHRAGEDNADFERRLSRYRDHALPWPERAPRGPFSQLLAIQKPGATPRHAELVRALEPLSVIRTTSPLDHESFWYEVFAAGVSKASGARWLRERHAVPADAVLAIGNDFNDEALLTWAPAARVVANAPPALRERFPCVPSNDHDGFAAAVRAWLSG